MFTSGTVQEPYQFKAKDFFSKQMRLITKTAIFILTAMRTSNPTQMWLITKTAIFVLTAVRTSNPTQMWLITKTAIFVLTAVRTSNSTQMWLIAQDYFITFSSHEIYKPLNFFNFSRKGFQGPLP
jgi:hypothetical protein